MIVITSIKKLKQKTFIQHHFLLLKLLLLQGELCRHQIILITVFVIKQMMQLISSSVKLHHWINVLERWHMRQVIPSYWRSYVKLNFAIKREGPYELCYMSVISRHFKMLCKWAHKNYIIENVGFSRCSYVLRIVLADVIILEILLISEKLTIPVFQLKI